MQFCVFLRLLVCLFVCFFVFIVCCCGFSPVALLFCSCRARFLSFVLRVFNFGIGFATFGLEFTCRHKHEKTFHARESVDAPDVRA